MASGLNTRRWEWVDKHEMPPIVSTTHLVGAKNPSDGKFSAQVWLVMINVVKARNLAGISLVSTYLGGHQVHNKGTQSQSSGSKCCWVAQATHSYTIISTSRNKNPRVQFLFSLRGPLWTWVNSWYYSANWISFVQQFLFPSIGGD